MPNDLLGSVRRTLRILDHLAHAKASSSPREIALATQSNISTVYHVLNTLTTDGYAKRDEATGRYTLGRKVASLGHAFVRRLTPPKPMRNILRALSESTGEEAYLTLLHGTDLIVADIVLPGKVPWEETIYRGYSTNFHALAMGKATLAYCPPSFLRAYFTAAPPIALTSRTLRSVDAVKHELERVRAQGFAECLGEFTDGACAVGAPIFDGLGGVYGAISLCTPTERYPGARSLLREAVIRAASTATQTLAAEAGANRSRPSGERIGEETEQSGSLCPG